MKSIHKVGCDVTMLHNSKVFFLGKTQATFDREAVRLRKGNIDLIFPYDQFHELSLEMINLFHQKLQDVRRALGEDYFWLTPYCSGSATHTNLYHDFVLYQLYEALRKKSPEAHFLIESESLYCAIQNKSMIKCNVQSHLHAFLVAIYFFMSFAIKRFLALFFIPFRKPPRSFYLVRSWMTRNSLHNNGQYFDRNFGSLLQFFNSKNTSFVVLPSIFNIERGWVKQCRILQRSKNNFLVTEQWVKVWDILLLLARFFKLQYRSFKSVTEDSIFNSLIEYHHKKNLFGYSFLKFHTDCYIFNRLKTKGYDLSRVYYTFENNAIEHNFLREVRKHYPQVKTIGFQHTVWLHEQPSHFLLNNSSSLPDFILTKGSIYLKILREHGFERTQILLGANLRFPIQSELVDPPDKKSILAILNFDNKQVFELLNTLSKASLQTKGWEITIRLHPLNNAAEIKRWTSDLNLKVKFCEEKNVQLAVEKARVVVCGGASVTVFESFFRKRGTILVEPPMDFGFSPIWTPNPYIKVVRDSVSLVGAVMDLDASYIDSKAIERSIEETKKIYFEEINENSLQRFMDLPI